jgi:hypothetical protein
LQGTVTDPSPPTCVKTGPLFGIYFCTTPVSASVTVSVPITIFTDHPYLASSLSSPDSDWYYRNQWHLLTYYAVAPAQSPSGTHNCSTGSQCLTINYADGTAAKTNLRGVVVLAGRSLSGIARPNGTLADFLDGSENTNGDLVFQQAAVGPSFNDRVYALKNY